MLFCANVATSHGLYQVSAHCYVSKYVSKVPFSKLLILVKSDKYSNTGGLKKDSTKLQTGTKTLEIRVLVVLGSIRTERTELRRGVSPFYRTTWGVTNHHRGLTSAPHLQQNLLQDSSTSAWGCSNHRHLEVEVF